MNVRSVLFVLGNLLAIVGLAMIAPFIVAVLVEPTHPLAGQEVVAFAGTASVALLCGMGVRWWFHKAASGVRLREGLAIVSLSWLVLAAVGMLPYWLSGATDSVADAFFETISGFTTTGASIFPKVEVLPPGLQFWRCMTQWLGGMGIVVLSVALLPMLGMGGYRLLKAEAPGGVAFERDRPRITDAAKQMWKLYILLSIVQTLLLWVSGMSPYDAVCHAFTTMSTGGFSPHTESVAYFSSAWIQWIIIVFMAIAGTNFAIHARLFQGDWRSGLKNAEFQVYVAIVVVLSAIGVMALASQGLSEKLVRDVVFQVLSIGTTTGYATADYDAWPQVMRLLLFGLMFVGGCMGSTAGGMKVGRLVIYAKIVVRELHRLVFPRGVRPIRVGQRVIEEAVVSNILAFALAYAGCFALGCFVMAACGYDLISATSASAAALGNIGPGLGLVGPTANWAHLPDVAKWVMGFLMLIGRLELFSVLIMFTPWMWRR